MPKPSRTTDKHKTYRSAKRKEEKCDNDNNNDNDND